jgi:mRNA interferase MazF
VADARWGEVWNVDFGVPKGHEHGAERPAVVVSSDWFNKTEAELHVVVPLSSKIRAIGTHFRIDPPEGGLDVPSDAMCEHIRSVSADRLASKRGALDAKTMDELVKRLKVLLLMGSRGA